MRADPNLCVGMIALGVALTLSGPASAEEQQIPLETAGREIIVLGQRPNDDLIGILAEDEIDENDISAYGIDTLGDLLAEIGADLGEDEEGPVVLINGQLATGIDEISDLPAEAASKVQLLPRQAAARLGQGQNRRVINVILKRSFDQATANAERSFATAGKGTSISGGLSYTRLQQGNRDSLSLRLRDTDRLLESDRDIATVNAGTPFDLVGNILPFPNFRGEIDPALSSLVGGVVTAAGVPVGLGQPSLADFATLANTPNTSDLGNFRTLIGALRSAAINGTVSRRIDPRTTATVNLRADFSDGTSLLGTPTALLRVPAGSAFSPFTQDVSLARSFAIPLGQTRKSGAVSLGAVINRNFGKWNLSGSGNYSHRGSRSVTDRSIENDTLQAAILNGSVNPFAALSPEYIARLSRDLARSDSDDLKTQAVLTGSPLDVPAGPVATTFRLGYQSDRIGSLSRRILGDTRTSLRRNETNGQFNIDLPMASRRAKVLSGLGELRVNFNAGFRAGKTIGTIKNHGYGFSWQPIDTIALRGSLSYDSSPPPLVTLRDPTVIIEGVRFFDFVRGESVEVTLITGGNPAIPNEKRRTLNLGGSINRLLDGKLTLNIDYSRQRNRDQLGSLPPLNAAIETAFPERFQRDLLGRLIQVDSRAVSFARENREQLSWGFSITQLLGSASTPGSRRLGQSGPTPNSDGDEAASIDAPEAATSLQPGAPRAGAFDGLRLNLSANHAWSLTNERLIRAGLPVIDLLRGGAIGFSGGQPRHLVQFNAGLSVRGGGLQVSGTFRSSTIIRSGQQASPNDIRFSARTLANVRLFSDLGAILPENGWAKGLRLTLEARNLFDSLPRVRDRSGMTPLRYQPYLLDPLGRSVTIALRKVL